MIGQDADCHCILKISELSATDQTVNILGFVGHAVSVAIQLFNSVYYNMKIAIGNA